MRPFFLLCLCVQKAFFSGLSDKFIPIEELDSFHFGEDDFDTLDDETILTFDGVKGMCLDFDDNVFCEADEEVDECSELQTFNAESPRCNSLSNSCSATFVGENSVVLETPATTNESGESEDDQVDSESVTSDESYLSKKRKCSSRTTRSQSSSRKSPPKRAKRKRSSTKLPKKKLTDTPEKALHRRFLAKYNQNRLDAGLHASSRINFTVADAQNWPIEVLSRSYANWNVDDVEILESKFDEIYYTFKPRLPDQFTGNQRYQVNQKLYLELLSLAKELDLLVAHSKAIDWRRLHTQIPFTITTTSFKYWNESDRAQIKTIISECKKKL